MTGQVKLKQSSHVLTCSQGLLLEIDWRNVSHRHVVVHKWLIRRRSGAHCDATAPNHVALTNLLAYVCHLRPGSLCPCERTVSSAWLQPLCVRAITGRARPPPVGGGTRHLSVECVCCLKKHRPLHFPEWVYLFVCGKGFLKKGNKAPGWLLRQKRISLRGMMRVLSIHLLHLVSHEPKRAVLSQQEKPKYTQMKS